MNALKNVLFFGLLIAVLFGVYISLNRQPEVQIPRDVLDTAKEPTLSIPGMPEIGGGAAPQANPAGNTAASGAGGLPSQPPAMAASPTSSGGMAPLSPYPSGGPAGDASVAPSYRAQDRSSEQSHAADHAHIADQARAADQSLAPPPSLDAPPPTLNLPAPPGSNYPTGVADPTAPGFTPPGGIATTSNSASSSAPPWAGSANPPAASPAEPAGERSALSGLDMIMKQVETNVNQHNYAKALEILSGVYDNPDLPEAKARAITSVLDQLAAKVIYSREHLLLPRYNVQPSDTLDTIADHYKVPALLLAKINGVTPSQSLPPGKELKVLKGPFSGFVSTEHGEMTMKLEGCYAGRFPLAISNDLQRATGFYTVRGKSPPANAGRPTQQWIELNSSSGTIGIEATADLHSVDRAGRSTIWLSEQDMDDVYGILSVGSHVVIQR